VKGKFKSIKNQIIFFFIGVMMFQIAAVLLFAVFHLHPSIRDMYSEHLEKFSRAALWEMVSEKKKIETYMVNIIGDTEIQSFLENADVAGENSSAPAMSVELRNRILSYTDYDSMIRSIYLIDNQGRIYSNLSQNGIAGFLAGKEGLKGRKEAAAVWYSDYTEEDIVVYRIINNNTNDLTRKIGAICMVIDKDLLIAKMDQFLMEATQDYTLAGYDGQMYLSSADTDAEIDEQNYIISKQEGEDWYLYTWIDKSTAYAPIYMIFKILSAEMLVLSFISIGLVIYLSGRITRPISDIRNAMKQIGKGNTEVEVPISGEDEIGQLAATLNRMSKKIEDLVEQIRTEESNHRLLELKAMQYQINPHFLYNTLDAIGMFARKNNDKQCEELVIALSDFFRISLNHGQEFVSLQTELEYVRCYLEIQNVRFPDQINWVFDVEQGLYDIIIMKFILQPLVENSIYHGIRNAGRRGEIRIQACRGGGDIVLKVSDDGSGMRPEELTDLYAEINSDQDVHKDIHEGGFGLKNVHQRLKLLYGAGSGLQIESEWDEGTVITICIPNRLINAEGQVGEDYEQIKISKSQTGENR